MTFSDKMTDGPPVGPMNMSGILDDAITQLNGAVSGFQALGEDDLEVQARAVRARTYMSRAIWDVLNPVASGSATPMAFASARGDADFVLNQVGGSDWQFDMEYSSASTTCSMCDYINDRNGRAVVNSIAQAHFIQEGVCPSSGLGKRNPPHQQRKHHIFQGRKLRKQMM